MIIANVNSERNAMSDMTEALSYVAAFMSGLAVIGFGLAAWYSILGAIENAKKPKHNETVETK